MGSTLTVKLHITGLRETLRAFDALPQAADDSLSKRSMELAESLAVKVRAAASSDSKQSALMASTVRAKRARVPMITAGGSKAVGHRKVPAFKVLFGSEFGASRLLQFRPHVGQGSYWFFRTVEENADDIDSAWGKVADDIVRSFVRDGL
jgi:hypothetical protein